MEMSLILEYLFRLAMTLGIGLVIHTVKDFKLQFKQLTDKMAEVTLSLQSLLIKDENRAEKIGELKMEVHMLKQDVDELKQRVLELEIRTKE